MVISSIAKLAGKNLALKALSQIVSSLYERIKNRHNELVDEDTRNLSYNLKFNLSYLDYLTKYVRYGIEQKLENREAVLYAAVQKANDLVSEMLDYWFKKHLLLGQTRNDYFSDRIIGYIESIGDSYKRLIKLLERKEDLKYEHPILYTLLKTAGTYLSKHIAERKGIQMSGLENILSTVKKEIADVTQALTTPPVAYHRLFGTKNPIYGSDLRDSYTNKGFGYAVI